jgi:hypothetical protein
VRILRVSSLLCVLSFILTGSLFAQNAPPAPRETKNIVFVMTDGLRWQEVFRGADAALLTKEDGGVNDPAPVRKAYWRETTQERREALMPFLWSVIAKQGQVFGNRDAGSDAYVTNGKNFSYPGYSETLCGFPDARIDSNDKFLNPNVSVLEWLDRRPAFRGRIAAFGAWDLFPYILNAPRSGLFVNAGYEALTVDPSSPDITLLNALKSESPRFWPDEPFDFLTFHSALEYLKLKKPGVLYLSLGETDEWAHDRRYADYLDAAHRADHYLQVLWETLQSMPEYRGSTTLIFSPDHGRGPSAKTWVDHGKEIPESKYIWMAFLGPDTPALGERKGIPPVAQSQIAATLAALLGEDYNAAVPKAGKPIADVLPH